MPIYHLAILLVVSEWSNDGKISIIHRFTELLIAHVPGKAKVTAVYKPGESKHPYHLIAESGGGSTVYGWVDVSDIAEASASGPVEDWTPKKGYTVIYNGNVHYASAEATRGPACKPGMAKITDIYRLGQSKHPYHLVRVTGGGSTVYGWVDAGSFTKA